MLNNIYNPLNLILFDLSESTISSDYLLKIIVQILWVFNPGTVFMWLDTASAS